MNYEQLSRSQLIKALERQQVQLDALQKDKTRQSINRTMTHEQSLFNQGPVVIFKWKYVPGFPVEYVSPNASEVVGYSADDFFNGTVTYDEIINKEDKARVDEEVRTSCASGLDHFHHLPYRLTHKDGGTIWVLDYTRLEYDDQGSIAALLGYVLDITEEKKAQMALDKSKEKIQSLFRLSKKLEEVWSIKEVIESVKEEVEAILSLRNIWYYEFSEDGESLNLVEAIGGMAPRLKDHFSNFSSEKKGFAKEVAYSKQVVVIEDVRLDPRSKKNLVETLQIRSLINAPVITDKKHLGSIGFGTFGDQGVRTFDKSEIEYIETLARYVAVVIQRIRLVQGMKKAEQAIRASHAKYEALVARVNQVIFQIDADGRWSFLNPAWKELTGFSVEESLGVSCLEFVFREDRKANEEFFQSLINGETEECCHEFRYLKKTGGLCWVEVHARAVFDDAMHIIGAAGTLADISTRKKSEEKKEVLERHLQRSQRLETIGTLAGGIAHDFNNILTPILGYVDMALAELDEGDPLHEDLAEVLKAGFRAKELVRQLLLFAQQGEGEKQPASLQGLLRESMKLLQPSIPSNVKISQNVNSSCGKILADAAQIHQVIFNICTNAYQAMEDLGGTLSIELKEVEVLESQSEIKSGKYVKLSIGDTGPGLDKQTVDRIFEPFFTTKSVDQGTGLGLSVVHGIIEGHDGVILVESEPGKGTTFHIYLPLFHERGNSLGGKDLSEAKKVRIFLVDDDKNVGNLVKRMLQKLGFEADFYPDGRKALNAFQNEPFKYDLLITDLTMPEMTGLELSKQVHILNPDFPVMIMTGYGENLTEEHNKEIGIQRVIGKPIVLKDLGAAVNEILKPSNI